MPVYSFVCNKCKKKINLLQKFGDLNPVCNNCGKDTLMNRMIPEVGRPKFSGSGFYETDYKKNLKKPLEKSSGSKE